VCSSDLNASGEPTSYELKTFTSSDLVSSKRDTIFYSGAKLFDDNTRELGTEKIKFTIVPVKGQSFGTAATTPTAVFARLTLVAYTSQGNELKDWIDGGSFPADGDLTYNLKDNKTDEVEALINATTSTDAEEVFVFKLKFTEGLKEGASAVPSGGTAQARALLRVSLDYEDGDTEIEVTVNIKPNATQLNTFEEWVTSSGGGTGQARTVRNLGITFSDLVGESGAVFAALAEDDEGVPTLVDELKISFGTIDVDAR
jgi:hypothetical protein